MSTQPSTTTTTDLRTAEIAAAVTAEITATRMDRVGTCDWASPAVLEVLAEYAADLRDSIPFSVGLDRIRRAVEADRAARGEERAVDQAIRLVS